MVHLQKEVSQLLTCIVDGDFCFMEKSKIRLLYIASFILGIIGKIVMQSATSIGVLVLILAAALGAVALISAIVNTARLKRWGWVVCLVLFSALTLLLYIFVGPTTSKQVS